MQSSRPAHQDLPRLPKPLLAGVPQASVEQAQQQRSYEDWAANKVARWLAETRRNAPADRVRDPR
eukprot:2751156-Alexandrium_andersonii.AAC.1